MSTDPTVCACVCVILKILSGEKKWLGKDAVPFLPSKKK